MLFTHRISIVSPNIVQACKIYCINLETLIYTVAAGWVGWLGWLVGRVVGAAYDCLVKSVLFGLRVQAPAGPQAGGGRQVRVSPL